MFNSYSKNYYFILLFELSTSENEMKNKEHRLVSSIPRNSTKPLYKTYNLNYRYSIEFYLLNVRN